MNRTFFPLAAVACLCISGLQAQRLEVDLVVEKVLQEKLEKGVVPGKQRQATIAGLFEESGCTVGEQRLDKRNANVICTLPGESAATIVIGGHYDFIDSGQGIVDDWSGASMLPSLYHALKSQPRKHTYQFVAFAEEERGLLGSKLFVKKLTAEQRENLRGFVNLECLGLGTAKIWLSRADRDLAVRLVEISNVLKLPLEVMNIGRGADDDSHSFRDAGLPVITIHSLTQEKMPILHSRRDKPQAMDSAAYYSTYKLMAFYLAYLDLKLP